MHSLSSEIYILISILAAKALKKAWVEKQKIKSKWKAEKRKEGLSSRSRIEIPEYSDQEDLNNDQQKDASVDIVDDETQTVASSSHIAEREREPRKPHLHPSRAHLHPSQPVKRSSSAKSKSDPPARPAKRPKLSKDAEAEHTAKSEQPSLRDLTREAYSRSTLHTFKSDPLKKKRVFSERSGQAAGGRRHQGVTGRGQPNMKLRMNAMLQKIKQDFA